MEKVEQIQTAGKRLKELYLDNADQKKKQEYTETAAKFLNDAVKYIETEIKAGKQPIFIKSSQQTTSGIITSNHSLVNLFQDFLFNVICKELADKMDLVVDFQTQAHIDPNTLQQPMIDIVMVCTFK